MTSLSNLTAIRCSCAQGAWRFFLGLFELDALGVSAPNDFVQLHLDADWEGVFEDPGDEIYGIETSPDWGGQKGGAQSR